MQDKKFRSQKGAFPQGSAARRRTTLRALVESALRREIFPANTPLTNDAAFIEHEPNELPCLKARGAKVTSKMVYQMLEAEGC